MTAQTILHHMQHNAESNASGNAFTFLSDDGSTESLTHSQLWQDVCKVSRYLRMTVSPGSRILIFYPSGLEYIKVFYGCLLAGMVAVPLYPPRRNVKSDRIVKIAESCSASLALTGYSELENVQTTWQNENQSGVKLEICALDFSMLPVDHAQNPDKITADQPAFLQYTSGSTGTPKGVTITHGNILANMRHLESTSSGNNRDVFVNWAPLFHDMGLVVTVLWPVYLGTLSVLMAPATFVRNPLCWLQAIHKYRGSICGAPNFAYDLCTDKIDAVDLKELDLSSWRIAFNSAEPVKYKTMEDFFHKFAQCGFRENTFYPAYGMAEATVFVAGGTADESLTSVSIERSRFTEHKLVPVAHDDPNSIRLVACGRVSEPHDLKIVDPQTRMETKDGEIGEIWFGGPSVSPRYWGLEKVSTQTFEQRIAGDLSARGYLRTGDLGAMLEGQVFVTGRMKDLIIFHGKNYYPQDIEDMATNAHSAVRSGHCAAFAVDADNEPERLILVAELERQHFRKANPIEIEAAIRERIFMNCGVNVDEIVLLKPYSIPMTSSGKIRRGETRQLYLNRKFEVIHATDHNVRTFVEPESEIERILCDIWSRLLKVSRVGIHDNFFDLGGNSLVAIEISSQIKRRFHDTEMDISQLLEMPTVAQMAQFIQMKFAYQESRNRLADSPGADVVFEI